MPKSAISQNLAHFIILVRNHRVILDSDLATLYGVETKHLNRAVKRNPTRFPEDFMFRLTKKEVEVLRYQFVTSKTPPSEPPRKKIGFHP
jgi:hypothetical protein